MEIGVFLFTPAPLKPTIPGLSGGVLGEWFTCCRQVERREKHLLYTGSLRKVPKSDKREKQSGLILVYLAPVINMGLGSFTWEMGGWRVSKGGCFRSEVGSGVGLETLISWQRASSAVSGSPEGWGYCTPLLSQLRLSKD